MPQTHFEKLLDAEMEKLLQASITCPPVDSHRQARIQGQYSAYSEVKKLYREAAQIGRAHV